MISFLIIFVSPLLMVELTAFSKNLSILRIYSLTGYFKKIHYFFMQRTNRGTYVEGHSQSQEGKVVMTYQEETTFQTSILLLQISRMLGLV